MFICCPRRDNCFRRPRCRNKWIVGHIRSHLVHISPLLGCLIGMYLLGEAHHEPDPQLITWTFVSLCDPLHLALFSLRCPPYLCLAYIRLLLLPLPELHSPRVGERGGLRKQVIAGRKLTFICGGQYPSLFFTNVWSFKKLDYHKIH